MALPGSVSRHHVTSTSLEAVHDSAERYIDNVSDAVDSLLRAAKNTVDPSGTTVKIPDVLDKIPTPTVGLASVTNGHLYVCLTKGVWTQVI